jgi:hypothetical protein
MSAADRPDFEKPEDAMHSWLERMDAAEDFPAITEEMLDPMLLAWREGYRQALRDFPAGSGPQQDEQDSLYFRLMEMIAERYPETRVQGTLRNRIAYLMQQLDTLRSGGPQQDVERLTETSASLHIVLGDMVDEGAPDKWLGRLYDVAEEIEAAIEALRSGGPTPEGERLTDALKYAESALKELDNLRWDDIWQRVASSDDGGYLAKMSAKYLRYARTDLGKTVAVLRATQPAGDRPNV